MTFWAIKIKLGWPGQSSKSTSTIRGISLYKSQVLGKDYIDKSDW